MIGFYENRLFLQESETESDLGVYFAQGLITEHNKALNL